MLSARHSFDAIGTVWSIDTERPLADALKHKLAGVIEEFDKAYSRFRSDSLVLQARECAPGRFQFPVSIGKLYTLYCQLYELSGGSITPLVGGSLEQLGYDAQYSLHMQTPVPAPNFIEALELKGNDVIFTSKALLDISAIGKGYLVDEIASIVAEQHEAFVIDASGDMTVHTATDEIIGLEDPFDASRIIGTVSLRRGSLCASATNRRAWGNGLHHILDGTTGRPLHTNIAATWAIASTTMLADALTTGLFFVAPTTLAQTFGDFSYVILNHDGSVAHNLPPNIGEVFT